MASIQKITGKNGTAYKLYASQGRDADGKQIRPTMTFKLEPGLSEKQARKAAERAAYEFEKQVETGVYLDGSKLTFAEFTQKWLTDYAEKRLAPGTLKPYRMKLEKRILPALGHLKMAKI